ncbi:hypothetical protein ACOSQ3_003056 [Xanthoceras sorbifolium]
MDMEEKSCKAHVLIIPCPAQGRINPMLQFSKRLVFKGIKATLVTTISLSKTMHVDQKYCSSIAIETISDGSDNVDPRQPRSIQDYFDRFKVVGSETLAKLIKRLDDIGQPVTALIYDSALPWVLDVAKQFGLLGVVFFTQTCAVNSIYYHVKRGFLPVPLSGSDVSIPGLPLLQASETPSFIYDLESTPPGLHDLSVNQLSNIDEADWLLFNTFYKLEDKVVDWMAKRWKVGTIGPTLPSMYLDKRIEDDKDYGINLYKPKTIDCISWLNNRPSGSVVYVSFGSVAYQRPEQIEELAWGLKGSKYNFLWVVRESEQTKLPDKFKEETSDQGMIVSWCPQMEVLAHESVGCFVTHCGLSSVFEATSLGVAMVAVPHFADQPTNAKYVVDVWGTGVRAFPDEKGIMTREVVENCIKEIMEGEKGKEIKENAKKWKNLAREAIDEGGSSDKDIDEFVARLVY